MKTTLGILVVAAAALAAAGTSAPDVAPSPRAIVEMSRLTASPAWNALDDWGIPAEVRISPYGPVGVAELGRPEGGRGLASRDSGGAARSAAQPKAEAASPRGTSHPAME